MEATLKWNGTRQRNGLNKTAVDGYTNQLLQILTEGRTQHPEVFYQSYVNHLDGTFIDKF